MKQIALVTAVVAALAQSAVAETLSADDLSSVRAGEAPQLIIANRQTVTAVSTDNVISTDSLISGDVSFSQGAFANFNGIGNIVVNTGSNNAIQGTLSVTVVGLP